MQADPTDAVPESQVALMARWVVPAASRAHLVSAQAMEATADQAPNSARVADRVSAWACPLARPDCMGAYEQQRRLERVTVAAAQRVRLVPTQLHPIPQPRGPNNQQPAAEATNQTTTA